MKSLICYTSLDMKEVGNFGSYINEVRRSFVRKLISFLIPQEEIDNPVDHFRLGENIRYDENGNLITEEFVKKIDLEPDELENNSKTLR